MARAAWILLVAAAGLLSARVALADQLTLTNGDVLHGEVVEKGARIRIQHSVLGTLDVPRSDVLWIARDGEVAPPVVSAEGERAIALHAPCAPVPDAAVEKRPSPWEFAVGFGISSDHGNTEKLQLNADLMAGYRWGPNHLQWRINSFYEEASGVQTEGKYSSHLRYTRALSPRSRLFGLWLVDRDDFADIELRNGMFGGLEYDVYKTERTRFAGALGAGWITEKRKNREVLNTAAALVQLQYEHEFQHGDTFKARWYAIPYLDEVELSPQRLELSYAHPLREHIDLVVAYLLDYVPDPPPGIEPLDSKFTVAVRWKP